MSTRFTCHIWAFLTELTIFFYRKDKGLSHWRRRRRCDWPVAATRATRETPPPPPKKKKNGLRSHQGDVSETSPYVTTNSPGSRGDIAATSPRCLLSCGDVFATSPAVATWRVGGDISGDWSLRWLGKRLRDVSCMSWRSVLPGVAENSNMFDFVRLFQVSSRSRRGRRIRRLKALSLRAWRLGGDEFATRVSTQRRLESPTSRHLVSRPVR